MKKLLSVLVVALLISLSAVSASALNFPYFTQDDFALTFGTANNPGSANSSYESAGRVTNWSANIIAYGYSLSGITTGAVSDGAGHWVTTYTGTLTIFEYLINPNPSNVFWTGTGSVTTIVNQNGSTVPAANYTRPSYESTSNPNLQFSSVGYGAFSGAGNADWSAVTELSIPWFGTYNWNYLDPDHDGDIEAQRGNAEGMLTVAEPGTIMLLGFGLFGLAGFAIRRKK
jgi:hypothetical protein